MKAIFFITLLLLPIFEVSARSCAFILSESLALESKIVAKGVVTYSDYDQSFSFKQLAFWRWFYKENEIDIKIIGYIKGKSDAKKITISHPAGRKPTIGFESEFQTGEKLLLFLTESKDGVILDPNLASCRSNVFSFSQNSSMVRWTLEEIEKLKKNSNVNK